MKNKFIKNICCIGAGYVGGPTMSVIAFNCPQIKVDVVDVNNERIESWNSKDFSQLPIFEPGLEDIVKKCRGKNLFFSNKVEESIANADIIFISVNTPTKIKGIGAGFASDLKWIESSARQIAKFARNHTVVVEEHSIIGGLFSLISEKIASSSIKTNLLSISLPDKFGPTGTYNYLLDYHGLSAEKIKKKISFFLNKEKG